MVPLPLAVLSFKSFILQMNFDLKIAWRCSKFFEHKVLHQKEMDEDERYTPNKDDYPI